MATYFSIQISSLVRALQRPVLAEFRAIQALVIASLTLTAACTNAEPDTDPEPEKMRVTLQTPLNHPLGENLLLFEREVETRTGGRVDVEIYDSAILFKDEEVPTAVGAGMIEAGAASLTQYVGEAPVVDIFYMPFLFDSYAKVRAAVSSISARLISSVRTGTSESFFSVFVPVTTMSSSSVNSWASTHAIGAETPRKSAQTLISPSFAFI